MIIQSVIKPYGEYDPYAVVELIASTKVHSNNFSADQMPALSARVSHAADGKTGENTAADSKLMRFLADHKHMTPFEHQSATFRIVAPLFVFREWHRHRTQSYNEVSMRYTDDPVGKFYIPQAFRKQDSRNKQGSAKNIEGIVAASAHRILAKSYNDSLLAYENLLACGVAREQARMVVPVGNYSEMYATANLRNWFAFWVLRHTTDAQQEIRVYADAIDTMLSDLWPKSWKCLKESYKESK